MSASTAATTTGHAPALRGAAAKFRDRILSFAVSRAFLWLKMPLAGFAGLRVRRLEAGACEVTVPHGWRTRNPFGSVYFAAHAMAAELSTGALVLLHAAGHEEASVSTLITRMVAAYMKAAKGEVTYRCEQGAEIAAAVRRAVETGEPVEVEVVTRGSVAGEAAAEFRFTWSMKRRAKK
jgi:acyl-coenzyme A thioesterase PaaI-like protein